MTTSTQNIVRRDYLLVLAVSLSPIDTLLPGLAGPGEVVVAIWVILALIRKEFRFTRHYLITFWYVLFLSFVAGTAAGLRSTPNETTASGLITWIVLGTVAISTFTIATRRTIPQVIAILTRSASSVSFVYFGLLLLWESGINTIGPLDLDFGGVRFTGGASNPHLLAIVLGFAIFAHISVIVSSRRPAVWVYRTVLVIFTFHTASATDSSTFTIAAVLTPLTWLILKIVGLRITKAERAVAFIFICLCITAVAGIFRGPIFRQVDDFISSDANGYDRIGIWLSFDHVLDLSPLIGLGPGTHAMYGQSEFHNMVLDIGAIGGLIAIGAFLAFVVCAVIQSTALGNTVLMILPYLFYGLAGFSPRRLSFWIIIPLILAAAHLHKLQGVSEVEMERRREVLFDKSLASDRRYRSFPISQKVRGTSL